jgi:hypothetical protein
MGAGGIITGQCWLKRELPCFDGTRDTLLTPLRLISYPDQGHRSPPGAGLEPGPAPTGSGIVSTGAA